MSGDGKTLGELWREDELARAREAAEKALLGLAEADDVCSRFTDEITEHLDVILDALHGVGLVGPDTPPRPSSDHDVEVFRQGIPVTFGFQCLNCPREVKGLLTVEAAEAAARRHGVLVSDSPTFLEGSYRMREEFRGLAYRMDEDGAVVDGKRLSHAEFRETYLEPVPPRWTPKP